MEKYLPAATDFTDMEVREKPDDYPPGPHVKCPVCKGYGGWNLRLNAYRPREDGTPRHFQASCSQCNGWGWVTKGSGNDTCVHHFEQTANPYMFEHHYTCKKCGQKRIVDSSG